MRVERAVHQVGRRALEDDTAAFMAGAGAEVDGPVGVRHHGLAVLDDDHRLARVHQPVQQPQQVLDVGEVQAGGRLVEHVDPALVAHVRGQLQPLPLAAGERGERLAQAQVAQPHIGHAPQDAGRGRRIRLAGAEAAASSTGRSSTSATFSSPSWY